MHIENVENTKDKTYTIELFRKAIGEIVKEQGYTGLTTNAIARKAGRSKILITRYFGSVEALNQDYIEHKDAWGDTLNYRPLDHLPLKRNFVIFLKSSFRRIFKKLIADQEFKNLMIWNLNCSNERLESKLTGAWNRIIDDFMRQLQLHDEEEIRSFLAMIYSGICGCILSNCQVVIGMPLPKIDLHNELEADEFLHTIDQLIDAFVVPALND